jgi:hypothetical protein
MVNKESLFTNNSVGKSDDDKNWGWHAELRKNTRILLEKDKNKVGNGNKIGNAVNKIKK